jgi:hypothetical protein
MFKTRSAEAMIAQKSMAATITFVKPVVSQSENVVRLSTIDQIMPRKYMASLFCFRRNESTSPDLVAAQLRKGLGAALAEAPHFAGEIQPAPGQRNELQLYTGPESNVLFRDCRQWTGANYDELVDAHFPTSLLPDDDLLVPTENTATESGGIRSLVIQANFIPGGLLLAVQVHHSLTDAKGSELFFSSWSRHTRTQCQGRPVDLKPFDEQALERWRLSYGSKKGKVEEFPEFREGPGQQRTTAGPEEKMGTVIPSIWQISPEQLDDLKNFASAQASSAMHVSKAEAVAALLCCHIYRARYGHGSNLEHQASSVTLYVASDIRSRLEPPLPPDYLGNASVIVPVPIPLTIDQLCAARDGAVLNDIAATIQRAVIGYDTTAVRQRIGFYNSQPAIGSRRPNLNYWPGPNMLIADISELNTYSLDWGSSLGQIDAFRTIGTSVSTGSCSVHPRLRDGRIEIFLRHEKRVIEAMRMSKELSRFARFVC